jgi:predicted glycoside hydrolase/deacetylase ChbG (UPF0249 family)
MSAISETSARSTGFSRNLNIPSKAGTTNRLPAKAGAANRRIILHADDFGMNAAVTDGILRGFDEGLLTSTSLLSNAPDAARALDGWQKLELRRREGGLKSAPRRKRLDDPAAAFDLGVHLNLTQGRPITGSRFPGELLGENGAFPGVFALFRRLRRASRPSLLRVEEELVAQAQFMLDHGHRPTHLNGHQYVELLPQIGPMVMSVLERFSIPAVRVAWEPAWRKAFLWPGVRRTQWVLGGVKKIYAGRLRRSMLASGARFADAFFGTMTAGTTTAATIAAFLAASRGSQVAEIGLHPALHAGDCPDFRQSNGLTACESRIGKNGTVPFCPSLGYGWRDPLCSLRPRELELVVSADFDEQLIAEGCRPGRLNM